MMLTIKLIYHHHIRYERVTFFFFQKRRGQMRNKKKIMSLCLASFICFSKNKRKICESER